MLNRPRFSPIGIFTEQRNLEGIVTVFDKRRNHIRHIDCIVITRRLFILVEISLFVSRIMSLANLLIAYSLGRVIDNILAEPEAQTRIIVKAIRITIADFKAGSAIGTTRATIVKNGIIRNFPVEHEFRAFVIIGAGEEKHSDS